MSNSPALCPDGEPSDLEVDAHAEVLREHVVLPLTRVPQIQVGPQLQHQIAHDVTQREAQLQLLEQVVHVHVGLPRGTQRALRQSILGKVLE